MIERSLRVLAMAAAAWLAGSASTAAQSLGDTQGAADTAVSRTLDAPVNTRPVLQKWWWDDAWFDNGQLKVPVNHKVAERDASYTNPADGTEVPATIYRPKGQGAYPGILFLHGRRGLDDLVRRLAKRMAARGFVVLAPDLYAARFIDTFPLEHKEATETDANAGVDHLLSQPDVSTSKACLYSHTRGGYYALRVAVTHKRQDAQVACYVSFYPHLQNPNATEPMQVYRYASEVDDLRVPTRIFIGEFEQYQRRRSIETAVGFMKSKGRDVRLIIYPGVGRGFDFRTSAVRTFADDLATKDSVQRSADFMAAELKPWLK